MTEKEMILGMYEREFPTTLKLLKAFPAARADFKPHERSRSAKELAWVFVTEQGAVGAALAGGIDFSKMPAVPATMQEIIGAFEKSHADAVAKIKRASDADLNKTVKFPVAPKKMGDVRVMDLCGMLVCDAIHHRGQFSVYLRLAGAKVPSIYGPSADEPWM